MENNAEIDPWAKMGNVAGNQSGEVNQEGLAREAEWNNVMNDAPEFSGNQFGETTPPTPESPYEPTTEQSIDNQLERDDNIADASAIINYGLNAAAREKGVEPTIQAINNFVPNGNENPIKQLLGELGINTGAEIKDLVEESHATKPDENAFRNENINAPNTMNKSQEGALNAIKEVKELVAEVQTSPAYANLRAEAMHAGKGIFEYAVSKSGVRDLTILFSSLSQFKETPSLKVAPETTPEPDKSNETKQPKDETMNPENDQIEKSENEATNLGNYQIKKPENETKENITKSFLEKTQIKNQSSTINSSPDTEATAKNESLL